MPLPPPDFARLLTEGGPYPSPLDGGKRHIRLLPGAPLSLPSGRVIAIEPALVGIDDVDAMAFTAQVEPGTYPVVLSEIVFIDADGEVTDSRVAAARLVIREEPVTRWEMAVTAGQDTSELGEDEYFGYPVDGGTGCFLDVETYRELNGEDAFEERVFDAMYPGFDKPGRTEEVPSPITLAVGEDPTALVFYTTGFGDGSYATWVGRTAAGEVACFVTDFVTLDDGDEEDCSRLAAPPGVAEADESDPAGPGAAAHGLRRDLRDRQGT